MMNMKYISNLRSSKLLKFNGNLIGKYSSSEYNGPATEDDIKKTAEFYKKIATKYHASNNLLTLGLHKIWRTALANNIEVFDGIKILDAPAGTGLNTLKMLEKSKHLRSDFPITMFDINPHMMKVGRDKFKELGYNTKLVKFVEGNLHKLPFQDETFDAVITSLANRPFVDFGLVLKEINRVLKSNGKVVILDYWFSQNPTILQRMYCNYIEFIASRIEKMFLGNLGTAEFVTESIRDVIAKTDLEEMLKEANFQKFESKPLTLGIAGLTIAFKI